jgi:hypothetical protein
MYSLKFKSATMQPATKTTSKSGSSYYKPYYKPGRGDRNQLEEAGGSSMTTGARGGCCGVSAGSSTAWVASLAELRHRSMTAGIRAREGERRERERWAEMSLMMGVDLGRFLGWEGYIFPSVASTTGPRDFFCIDGIPRLKLSIRGQNGSVGPSFGPIFALAQFGGARRNIFGPEAPKPV